MTCYPDDKDAALRACTHLYRRVLIVVACFVAMLAAAQESRADEDTGLWTAFVANGKLPQALNNETGSWRLWLDAALRFGDDASRLSQTILRAGTGYTLSDAWTVWVGYAYIHTEPPYADPPTDEHRIWEQAIWSGGISKTRLSARTRLEQRFFTGGGDTGWRLRELVKLTQPLGSNNAWSIVVSDEIFVNLNDAALTPNVAAMSGLDRNRFFVGPGVNLSETLRAEFGYMNQYTFRHNGPNKNDQILAVNVFLNF